LENPVPELKVELREVRFGYQKGKPELILDFSLLNEMKMELMLDRMLFEVNFHPTSGITLEIGSGVEIKKRIVPMGKWLMSPHLEIDPDIILRVDEQLTETFQCSASIMAFFEDFKEAYTMSFAIKIPHDEWQKFVELVLRNEKEKKNIREKRLAERIINLG
jgi:hypothetical protein